ncbi:MAG: ATP-binding protein [Pseudomonadota bacterium]
MDSSEFEQELAQERRARLAAERLLDQKQLELKEANKQLSDHALSLSDKIFDQREVVNTLQGENTRVSEDLEKANTRVEKTERILWAALENIPDGFALFGPDHRLIAANRPYIRAFDETVGVAIGDSYQTILDVCLDDGLIDLQGQDEDEWYDIMLDRWNADEIEPITIRFWDGMYVKMMDRKTDDGGIISLVLNITDTIHREEELRLARDKAEAADRAKSAFLAKMSHELRTPMNGVVGMADLLLEGDQDDESKLYTETIRNSGTALLEIINNILDFSKIEAEKLELRVAPFDLEQLVQEVAIIVGPTIRQKPITLQVDYDQFLPTEFMGDAGRIRQILVNLVGNAVKFTEEGSILVRIVGISDDDSQTCELHVTIEDTGIGIPTEMVDHVFGEFNQIEDEKNRKYEGTGLGLAITRKLVEVMGGEIWVDSVPNHGSCFGFRISLQRTSSEQLSKAVLPKGISQALAWVENALDKSVLARQMNLLGLDAGFVESAAEFDLALESNPPHVMISDMRRVDLIKGVLSKSRSDIPLLTLADQPNQEADIGKPYTRAVLLEALLAAVTPDQDAGTIQPLQVLAAEDNKTNQLVLTKMLVGANIELHIANDGVEAVEKYQALDPDLIFLDISMPRMDGMEAAQKIRELEAGKKHVPIVAMTAHAMVGDEERILESGIDFYMTKPLKKAELHKHIENVSFSVAAAVQKDIIAPDQTELMDAAPP